MGTSPTPPTTTQQGTPISRRDSDQIFNRPTDQSHLFVLQTFRALLLELEDVHFHFDSAVMMPDYGDCLFPADPADRNHVSGLGVLRACYLHAQRMPSNKLLLAGHTDRSGPDAYNFSLSDKRANNVLHLLLGNREDWITISDQQHKTEDIQQILIWTAGEFGWPCHPGPKNNVMNAATITAIRHFQETYNTQFDPDIAVDGDVGHDTWGAFFDVYMMGLKRVMSVDDAALANHRTSLTFVDDSKKTVGCGEKHPITQNTPSNYKSRIDRRVEILYFDPPQLPRLDCHPGPGTCDSTLCEIYGPNRIFEFEPLPCDPLDVGRRFRIRLEYGDIDTLFPAIGANTHTDAGIRQRLQAIGFLYEPLDSADIANIAQAAWDHFKIVESQTDDSAAAQLLQTRVRNVIMADNVLPATADEFNMIRFPGTWCVTPADLTGGFFGNPFAGGGKHKRVQLEDRAWNASTALGLLPIIAIVEQRDGENWLPAPSGINVHFQLITPDVPPAGSFTAPPALRSAAVTGSANSHTNPAPAPPTNFVFNMTGSPNKYVTDERARNPVTAGDPQGDNAHNSVGGKRGNAVAGGNRLQNIFETGNSRAGFHDTNNFTVAQASSHANAVLCTTNADGKSAVVFMPARTGGDRYKIRAFIDPIQEPGLSQSSNGSEPFAVKAETGTMVVFRIMRFSKYMRWDYPGAGVDPNHAAHFALCSGALNNFDIAGVIATEFHRAWNDVVVENLANSPQTIDQGSWRAAIQFAKGRISPSGLSQTYNLNVLIPDTTSTAGVHNNSAGLIRFLTDAQYDAAPKGPPPGGGWPAAVGNASFLSDLAALMHAMSAEIMHFFTSNAISGVTVFQCPVMTSTEADQGFALLNTPSGGNWLRSGWGGMRRGCYVTFGSGTYSNPGFPYDHNRNTMHEVGHTLYCPHQYTDAIEVNVNTGGGFDEHDYHDLCVMGYMKRRPGGDFCGRCALLFAGWETHAMPANSPGP